MIGPLLVLAGAAWAASAIVARRAARLWLTTTIVGCAAAFAAACVSLLSPAEWRYTSALNWAGDPLRLRLDALSGFFLALVALIGAAGALYGTEYWPERAHPRSARTWRRGWSGLMLSLGLVLLSAHGLLFLTGWETFALCSYFLITTDRRRTAVRGAGWLYLACSHAATLALFGFFTALASKTGSWGLGPLSDSAGVAPLFWLALFGFGVKAGLFPLHVWLPSAHANAPSHVSAILSGVAIKMGIYGIVRFSGWLPVPVSAAWTVVALGLASAVLGVAFALAQHDLKRLLAYHSVENIGIILLGLGFAMLARAQGQAPWGLLALAGGLLHVWNHGLFKALLFLGAGSVLHATHTREMSSLGGIWPRLPWTTALFALGAAAIAGLPPLNGFVSEWLVYLGLFDAVQAPPRFSSFGAQAAIVLLALTGALALACFIKVCGVVFLGAPRSPAGERAHEAGLRMRAPMLALAGACAAIGLAPMLVWPLVARAAAIWNPAWAVAAAPANLRVLTAANLAFSAAVVVGAIALLHFVRRRGVRRAVSWDCGYARPTPRMQYTAGSFAALMVDWFHGIVIPRRAETRPAGYFPAFARQEVHTPETVLARVIEPCGFAVLALANRVRRLQHGRVQAYLGYLLVGLATVGALVVLATTD